MGGGCRYSPPLLASSPLLSFLSSPLIFQSAFFPSCVRLPSHLRIGGARSSPFPGPHLSSLAAGSIGLLICTRHENNPSHSLFLPFMHSPSFRSLVPPFFCLGAHPRPLLVPPTFGPALSTTTSRERVTPSPSLDLSFPCLFYQRAVYLASATCQPSLLFSSPTTTHVPPLSFLPPPPPSFFPSSVAFKTLHPPASTGRESQG